MPDKKKKSNKKASIEISKNSVEKSIKKPKVENVEPSKK